MVCMNFPYVWLARARKVLLVTKVYFQRQNSFLTNCYCEFTSILRLRLKRKRWGNATRRTQRIPSCSYKAKANKKKTFLCPTAKIIYKTVWHKKNTTQFFFFSRHSMCFFAFVMQAWSNIRSAQFHLEGK